jgi:hypothetical protein
MSLGNRMHLVDEKLAHRQEYFVNVDAVVLVTCEGA